jgi:hypothetical protein
MNKQIQLLEKQAFDEIWDLDNDPIGPGTQFVPLGFIEKFAELIVEECIWKIMQRKEEAIDNDWHVDEAMSAAITDISEHFGVEE